MRRRHRLLIVIAAAAAACGPARGWDLVLNGSPRGSIVIASAPPPSEQFAADELGAYVNKISGATLPVTAVPAAAGLFIGSLGTLANIPAAISNRLAASASDEAFYLKSEGARLWIVGKRPIGALYGAYTFLEDVLGVRWFYPGDLGEHCPSAATIAVPDLDTFQEPDLRTRIQGMHTASYNFYDSVIWCARQKMQNSARPAVRWREPGGCTAAEAAFLNAAVDGLNSAGGHGLFDAAVPDSLYAEHPDFFPLIGGERVVSGLVQRCLSNPGVFQRMTDYGRAWCNASPSNLLSICGDDSRNTWCECEACRTMGTANGVFTISTLYHRFFSQVVNAILAQNSDARIDVFFYIDYAVAPGDPSIRYSGKNVRGLFCTCWPHARCYAHDLADPACSRNRTCLANLRGVLAMCPRLYTYEYVSSSRIPYSPLQRTFARDIVDLAALGVEGFMDPTTPVNGIIVIETGPYSPYAWQGNWPALYLSAKLHWDLALDPDAVLDEAYGLYYGPAAAPMKAYHERRMALWTHAPGHAYYGGPERTAYCLTVPGAEPELRARLAEARALAAGRTQILERLDLDEFLLDEFWRSGADTMQAQFDAEKQILPKRTQGSVAVDGDLSEPVWVSARPMAAFRVTGTTNRPPAEAVNFRVAYDNDALFIGFWAMNDKAAGPPVAAMTQRDSALIWSDDRIELLLTPPDSGGRIYHLAVNTRGVLYDAAVTGSATDLAYNAQAQVAVAAPGDRHVYELRLPLAPMQGCVLPGSVWGLQALRDVRNLPAPEPRELCSLDGNDRARPDEYRQAVFGLNAVRNGNFSDIIPDPTTNKGVTGGLWFRHWGVTAQEAAVVDDGPRPARMRLKSGTIYTFLQLPGSEQAGALVGEAHASGTGRISFRTSTCLRPPTLLGGLPFSHDISKSRGPFDLAATSAVFRFTIPLDPYEVGYLYVSTTGDAVLSHLSGVFADHAIAFPAIPDQTTTNRIGLRATASSGLPVSFAVVHGPAAIAGETNLSFSGSGTVRLAASVPPDTNWYPAPAVTQTFSVVKAAQAPLVFSPASPQPLFTTNTLSAAGGSGSGALSFSVLSGPGRIVDGSKLAVTDKGTIEVAATKAGDALYLPQTATATVIAGKREQTVAFAAIPPQTVTSTVSLSASASSGLPVQFAVVSGPGQIADGTLLSFTDPGTVRVAAAQGGDADWYPAAATNTVQVNKLAARVSLQGLAQTYNGRPRTVTASTVPAGLPVRVTYNGGAAAPVHAGSYRVVGSVQHTRYAGGATGTLTVAQAAQAITFPPVPDQAVGARLTLSASASSALPVSFAVQSGPAVLSGTRLSFTGPGSVSLAARQPGNTDWKAAATVLRSFLVHPNAPRITPVRDADFDGDGLADPTLYDAQTGTWTTKLSGGGYAAARFPGLLGGPGWAATAADYDGDRLADPAVYREATGHWVVLQSRRGYAPLGRSAFLGGPGWAAAAADYDGDGKADYIAYQEIAGHWKFKLSAGMYRELDLQRGYLGGPGRAAVPADYDGDGFCDPAVYAEAGGSWKVLLSASNYEPLVLPRFLGGPGWLAAPGDYDGDGLADPAVTDPASGAWTVLLSTGGYRPQSLPGFLRAP